MADDPLDPLDPPKRPATDSDERRRTRIRMLAGVGIPSVIGAVVAGLLGIPWWIVVIFLFVVAAGILLNS